VNEEKKFFEAVSLLFKKFENLEAKMKSLDTKILKSGTDYNPAKYIRGFKLLNGVNVAELPSVQNSKKTEKYSYEEYVKSKNINVPGGNNSSSNSNVPNLNNPTTTRLENSPNKFSYDQYKMKKQLNKSSDNILQDSYSKIPNTFSSRMNLDNSPTKTSFGNNFINQNNQNNFLNFELTKSGMNQTTILTPLEENRPGEQVKDTNSYNPYSALSFDMTPQHPKMNYGGSYLPNNNLNNRANLNYNQQSPNNPNYGFNLNMPNYNNGYSVNNPNSNPNNFNMNNLPNNNFSHANLKFPK